jgi:hypothetical protein
MIFVLKNLNIASGCSRKMNKELVLLISNIPLSSQKELIV